MAVLLDITYSKKLGLPNYSSHSLGIGLKAEVANLDEVRGEVEKAYSLLQQSVDSQIVHSGFVSNEDKGENGTDQVQKTQGKVLLAGILMAWPELVFGAEAVKTVKIGPDFGPLVDAARIAGCCSVLVALIWGTSLVIAARTRTRGGDPKCGE
jgi:hypothetical protein